MSTELITLAILAQIRKGLQLALIGVTLVLAGSVLALPLVPAEIAYADDDDDDGDDDDDNGGSRGGSGGGGSSSGGSGSSENNGGGSDDSDDGASGWSDEQLRPRKRDTLFSIFRRQRPVPTETQNNSPRRSQSTDRRRTAPPPPPPVQSPRVIVALGLTDNQIEIIEGRGYEVLERDSIVQVSGTITRLQVPSGTSLDEARTEIAAVSPSGTVDFNHYYRTEEDPSDLERSAPAACDGYHCQSLNLIGWPAPNGPENVCQSDIRIGMVDTGINPEHETFSDSLLEVLTIVPENQTPSSLKHGTAIAAILVGSPESRSPGLLPGVELIAVDAFYRAERNDERSDVYSLVRALDLLAERDIDILNLSFSGPANKLLEDMLERLRGDGMVVVAAAGNKGPRAEPTYPAAYENVIAVTAVDRSMNIYRRAGRGAHIDFSAPGVDVWTAASISGARSKTGTSYATPFVTAAIALARMAQPDMAETDVLETLASRSRDLGEAGKDDVFGHGLIQATDLCVSDGRAPL